jgi:CPA1 family monovalent cation:H+ antiporter
MTPYVAYWVPAELGGSGVLATVAAGLYVSWNGPLLIPAATRLQGIFFWDLVVYYLEGLIFLVMGLQARTLIDRMNEFSPGDLAFGILLIVGIAVIARFIWVFPAVYVPRWLSPALAKRDPSPPWQWAFLLAFIGIRGVVSLAAALGLPFYTASGAPFPYRDLILFITFGSIVVTLIGQGLLLPRLVLWLGLNCDSIIERREESEAEHRARMDALKVAKLRLDELADGNDVPEGVLSALQTRHDYRASRLHHPSSKADGAEMTLGPRLRSELIDAERKFIFSLLQEGQITDESRRRMERELDLEEASVACQKEGGIEPPL